MYQLLKELKIFIKYPRRQLHIWKCKIKNNTKYRLSKNIKDNFTFNESKNPKVSIIIPVYNQYQYTINCLYSILKNTKNVDYEIIVADDCSTDKTKNIQDKIKNIKYIKTEANCGFLRNCNNALGFARGEYIWLLNNDTQVQKDALLWLVKTFEVQNNVGAVGSKLILADKTLQEAGAIIYKDGSGYNYGKGDNPSVREFNYLKKVDYCSGASFLIKRDILLKLGGFDETFVPAYYEESDLCFRLRQEGLNVYYQPKSEVIHFESVSLKEHQKDLLKINKEKFFNKWSDILKEQSDSPMENFKARDRSQNQKVLLFIDNSALKQDINSLKEDIKSFINKGFNVKYICVKSLLPDLAEVVEQLGVEVIESKNRYAERWLQEYGKYVDFIFVNKKQLNDSFMLKFNQYCKSAQVLNQAQDELFYQLEHI